MDKQKLKYAQNQSILLIEDDDDFRESTATFLGSFFKDVDSAKNGRDGLDIYVQNMDKYSIVLSDITMPNLCGLEMSKRIKELNRDQPIVLISAHNDTDKFIKAIEIGVESFLLKPIDFSLLIDKLLDIGKRLEIDKIESEKRILELELIQRSKMAMMGEMIGAISHQWNQPLTIISMCIDELKESLDNDKRLLELGDRAKDQINFMSGTIKDFMSFFKPNKEHVYFEIGEPLEVVKTILTHRVMKIKAEIIEENLSGERKYIKGFKNEFVHLLLILFNNSLDAFEERGHKDGRILIQYKFANSNAHIRVLDNGGGIKDEIFENIFNPYNSSKKSGTGVGLSITKMIVEKSMRGTIEAKNNKDGAEFCIVVPLVIPKEMGE